MLNPEGSERGPLIDRGPLRLYRPGNAPAFRAWARPAYLWDRYGTAKGRRVYATRPKVFRTTQGHAVTAAGDVILERGRPVHWAHPLAVRTDGYERNPEADRIPVLMDPDLVALCFDGEAVDGGAYRRRLVIARRTVVAMAQEGRIGIERRATDRKGRRGWRVVEARPAAEAVTHPPAPGAIARSRTGVPVAGARR